MRAARDARPDFGAGRGTAADRLTAIDAHVARWGVVTLLAPGRRLVLKPNGRVRMKLVGPSLYIRNGGSWFLADYCAVLFSP